MSRTSSASGLLKRNIITATGVSARTAPASRPAVTPNWRLTVAYSTPTEATPMSTSGMRMLNELSPNARTDSVQIACHYGGPGTHRLGQDDSERLASGVRRAVHVHRPQHARLVLVRHP